MKILIVEDDFMSRKLMTACLSHLGEIDVATNGTEAVEAFLMAKSEGNSYDLIMLDIMMPEMNGQEVLKRIRQIEENPENTGTSDVNIVMTTALKDSTSVMTAFENQCDGYLVKPIDVDKVHALFKELGLEYD